MNKWLKATYVKKADKESLKIRISQNHKLVHKYLMISFKFVILIKITLIKYF